MSTNKKILARLAEAGIVETRETLKWKTPTGKNRGFSVMFTHRELDKHPNIEESIDAIENFFREVSAIAEKSDYRFTKRDFILKAILDAVAKTKEIAIKE